MKFKIILTLLLIISASTYAQQSDCSIKLEEAESLYETGILDSIPAMLRPCVEDGFDNDELARAYKLLILTYLFEDYQEMAELTMLKFLDKFPEYELKATDPIEFTYLYNSYETVPVYSIGAIVGLNSSYIRIIEPYSMFDINDYDPEYSSSGFSFAAGVQIKRYINDKIDINLDIIYATKRFEMIQKELDSQIEYSENLSLFSLPLSVTYDFKYKWLTPYARLGVNFDYLLNASSTVARKISGNNEVGNVKPSDIDIIDDRNKINVSAIIGAGVKYGVKKGYLMLDLRYYMGITNSVNDENRWDNEEKIPYYYVDDDFAVNNIFISIGYVFPFYKTKTVR